MATQSGPARYTPPIDLYTVAHTNLRYHQIILISYIVLRLSQHILYDHLCQGQTCSETRTLNAQ